MLAELCHRFVGFVGLFFLDFPSVLAGTSSWGSVVEWHCVCVDELGDVTAQDQDAYLRMILILVCPMLDVGGVNQRSDLEAIRGHTVHPRIE